MNVGKVFRTIYLGDRACKKIIIDGSKAEIRIQVDCISRIRSESGDWEYYTDEDIENGYIVFKDAHTVNLSPPGFIPNDLINSFEFEKHTTIKDSFLFILSIDSVNYNGDRREVEFKIAAKDLYLEDNLKIKKYYD